MSKVLGFNTIYLYCVLQHRFDKLNAELEELRTHDHWLNEQLHEATSTAATTRAKGVSLFFLIMLCHTFILVSSMSANIEYM